MSHADLAGQGQFPIPAAAGRLSLTDPLQRFAPEEIRVPSLDGRTITLDLPIRWAALPWKLPLEAPSGAAPFAWPTAADRNANRIDSEMFTDLTLGANGLIASLAPH